MEEAKRNVKAEAEQRAYLYNKIIACMEEEGYHCEPIKGGTLITIAPDTHAKISVSICSEEKVEKYIQEYADQQAKNAQVAAERAAKAEAKAQKAAERASKKAE